MRLAPDGKTYDRIDPKDGANFGFSVGFMVNPQTEIGFMFRRQMSEMQISGATTTDVGKVNIDGYHGYFAYYFGDPEARVNPYFLGGFGATYLGAFTYNIPGGAGTKPISGKGQFSSTWGTGIRVNAAQHVALKFGVSWTPTYIKSDPAGYWCDPWYGCYVVGNAQYANQFHFEGGITIRY